MPEEAECKSSAVDLLMATSLLRYTTVDLAGIGTVDAMGTAYAVSGILLLAFVMHDVIKTTLGQGGGYITTWLSVTLWKTATRLGRYGRHTMLYAAGLATVALIVVLWMGLLWIAWALIFSGSREAILSSAGWPASFEERLQFAGYAMVTLGSPAGFVPSATVWRAATVLAAANGFAVLTLGIAYITPLLSAATEKRQLALYISTLGESADEILVRAFEGEDCRSFESHLDQLTPMLVLLAQRYLTYPALHYFHSTNRSSAAAPSLAALDEALTVLLVGCVPGKGPSSFSLNSARRAISVVLTTLKSAYVEPAEEVPPPPALYALRRAGLETVEMEAFEEAMEEHADRRRMLLALVKSDGWNWNDVHHRDDEDDDGSDEPMTEVDAREVLPR